MLRVFFIYVIPVFLPLAVFLFYRRFFSKDNRTRIPYFPLFSIGLCLTGLCLYFFSVSEKSPASSRYTPPKYVNGRLIPAHMDSKNAP